MNEDLVVISVHNNDLGEYWRHITPEYASRIQSMRFSALLYNPEPAQALFRILLEHARNINSVGVEWIKSMENELCLLLENNPVTTFKIHRSGIPLETAIDMLVMVQSKVHTLVYELPKDRTEIARVMLSIPQFKKMTNFTVGGEVFSPSITSALMQLGGLRYLNVDFNESKISHEMYSLFHTYLLTCNLEELGLRTGKGNQEGYATLLWGISKNTSLRNITVAVSRQNNNEADLFSSLAPLLTMFDNKPFIEQAIFSDFFSVAAMTDEAITNALKARVVNFLLLINEGYTWYAPHGISFGNRPDAGGKDDLGHVVILGADVHPWTIDNLPRDTKTIKITNSNLL